MFISAGFKTECDASTPIGRFRRSSLGSLCEERSDDAILWIEHDGHEIASRSLSSGGVSTPARGLAMTMPFNIENFTFTILVVKTSRLIRAPGGTALDPKRSLVLPYGFGR
jgi:hypothetical protein